MDHHNKGTSNHLELGIPTEQGLSFNDNQYQEYFEVNAGDNANTKDSGNIVLP